MKRRRRIILSSNEIVYRTTKFVVIYIRVSTEDQARDGYGPESQERACREYCERRGWTIINIYKDEGTSGWKPVSRPQFKEMKEYIRKNKNVNVAFFDYSRIYRKASLSFPFFELLDSLAVYSVSACNPNIDCRTAEGRNQRAQEIIKAENQSDEHSEKQRGRMKNAVLSGRWPSLAPAGFENIRPKTKEDSNLAPIEPALSLIRDSFLLLRSGAYKPAELHREMIRRGMRSRTGKEYTLDQFLRILSNPAYIAMIPTARYGDLPGKHQRTVSDETFRDVQLILDGKKSTTAPEAKNQLNVPLRGFLRCHVCGHPLTGGDSKNRWGTYYSYYRCFNKNCEMVNVGVRTYIADGQFVDLLRQLPSGVALSAEFQNILRAEWAGKAGDSEEISGRLRRELRGLQEDLDALMMKYVKNDRTVMPYFESLKEKLEGQIANVQAQISATEETKATFTELLEFSRSISVNLANAWLVADIDQKQRVQKTLFPDGLKYDKEKGVLNPGNDSVFCQLQNFLLGKLYLVGERGFEPPTPWSRTRCSTRLSHSPNLGCRSVSAGAAWRV